VMQIHKCPDLCSLLIKACTDTGHTADAKDLFASLPPDLISERTLLTMIRVYRKEQSFPKIKEMFEMVKLLPTKHCKSVFMAYIQTLCWVGMFTQVEPVWEEFKTRVSELQAQYDAFVEWNKSDRGDWTEWHSTPNPLQEEKTYESMIRILSAVSPSLERKWEAEILPLLLKVIAEARSVPSPTPEFLSRLSTYFRWILKLPGLEPQNLENVRKQAQLLGCAV